MNAIGRDVAHYLYHMENGFINTFHCDTKVCDPVFPPIEIASTTFLKPVNDHHFWEYLIS